MVISIRPQPKAKRHLLPLIPQMGDVLVYFFWIIPRGSWSEDMDYEIRGLNEKHLNETWLD